MTEGRHPVTFTPHARGDRAAHGPEQEQAPHFYVSRDLEMDAAMDALAALNEGRDEGASGRASRRCCSRRSRPRSRRYPAFNAVWNGETLERVDAVNLGIAIDLGDGGLIAPALLDCDAKSRSTSWPPTCGTWSPGRGSGKLRAPEISEGTFTLTNLGMFGRDLVHGHHHAAPGVDAGHRRDGAARGRPRRPDRRAADHERHALVRPSCGGRGRRGAAAGRPPGAARDGRRLGPGRALTVRP